jgi:hypothetical protein
MPCLSIRSWKSANRALGWTTVLVQQAELLPWSLRPLRADFFTSLNALCDASLLKTPAFILPRCLPLTHFPLRVSLLRLFHFCFTSAFLFRPIIQTAASALSLEVHRSRHLDVGYRRQAPALETASIETFRYDKYR